MTQKNVLRLAMSALLLALWPASLFAQATFSVASAPTTAADIGLTELTGAITLSVFSGTTVAAPFRIEYTAPITNNSASEISVTGDGGLSGVALSPILDQTNSFILIDVTPGGISGDRIIIRGVRVNVANQDLTRVKAAISAPSAGGNAIAAG